MIEYRLAKRSDAELLKAIFAEDAIAYHPADVRQFLNEPTCQLYLALHDDRVIGYAYGYLMLRPDGKVMQQIYSLFVTKAYRKKGVATDLLDFILMDAQKIGCHKTWLMADPLNGAARRLYSKRTNDTSDNRCFYFYHE